MNPNEKRIKKEKGVMMLISLLVGGMVVGGLALLCLQGEDLLQDYLYLVYGLLVFYLFYLFQLIVHEAGHLVFGLAAGYRFGSFRIFNLTLMKQDGKLHFGSYRLAGTAGQCLMRPPERPLGKGGVLLYNLGGVILNLLTLPLFSILLAAALLFDLPFFLSVIPLAAVLAGLMTALLNGIPLSTGMVDNDGRNAYAATRSDQTLRAFDLQLKVTDGLLSGKRLKDLPDEWFVMPVDEELKNSMRATEGVLVSNRLMDLQDFEEAKRVIEHLLAVDSGIIGLHRLLLKMDLLYIELIGEGNAERIEALYTKELKKSFAAMKSSISVQRVGYAYALLYKKDEAEAQGWLALFEKTAKSYPYPKEAESERELIVLAGKRAEQSGQS